MNVLSLFDGISCGRVALAKAGIEVHKYYASEIDHSAMTVALKNYRSTKPLGNVHYWKTWRLNDIDLIMGGSPCQSLSIGAASKESGLEKGKSILFWKFAEIIQHYKNTLFLYENVASMKDTDKNIISETLGVEPIMINSALVSAQFRERYYWTNIKGVTQPENKHIYLKDIIDEYDTSLKDYSSQVKWHENIKFNPEKIVRIGTVGKGGQGERVYSIDAKSVTISANGGGMGAKTGLYKIGEIVRKLSPMECERLQTLPDGYTSSVPDTQAIKGIGNGWTVDVIKHIISFIN